MWNPKIILIFSNQIKFLGYKLLKCIEQYYNCFLVELNK